MAWFLLFLAGVFEVLWAVGLKASEGFTRPWPTVATLIGLVLSLVLLALALRTIPLGTGYAVWTGIGALGTAILGMALYHEPVTAWRIACIALIAAGILGLKWTAS
jgi:quaternary ammonium compound-resistance protein SugE